MNIVQIPSFDFVILYVFILSCGSNVIGVASLLFFKTYINRYFIFGGIAGFAVFLLILIPSFYIRTKAVVFTDEILKSIVISLGIYVILLCPTWIVMCIIFAKNKKISLQNNIIKDFVLGFVLYMITLCLLFYIANYDTINHWLFQQWG